MMSEQSVDSDLSDDALINQISTKWGREESQLRQAIFFQFIKTEGLSGPGSFVHDDLLSQYDSLVDHNSFISQDDKSGDPRKNSDIMSFTMHVGKAQNNNDDNNKDVRMSKS